MPQAFQVKIETITPEKAIQWLGLNHGNRPLKKGKVRQYAAEMSAGTWRPDAPICIAFDTNGHLRDGQNRLHALVSAKVTLPMVVARGMDPETFDVLDTGSKRSASDVLAIKGYRYAAATASAAKTVINFLAERHIRAAVTNREIKEFVADNPRLNETVVNCAPLLKVLPSSALAVLYLAGHKDPLGTEIARFVRGVVERADPEGWAADDPRNRLAAWADLNRTSTTSRNVRPEPAFSATAKAWNAFCHGLPIKRPNDLNSEAPPTVKNTLIVGSPTAVRNYGSPTPVKSVSGKAAPALQVA